MLQARRRHVAAAWAALLGTGTAGQAEASGYALREQSATALGQGSRMSWVGR
jgi:hypothetical protein